MPPGHLFGLVGPVAYRLGKRWAHVRRWGHMFGSLQNSGLYTMALIRYRIQRAAVVDKC